MKIQKNKNLLIIISTTIVLSFVYCTSMHIADIPNKPVSQYDLFQEKDGLRIAVDPFFEKDRVKKFFGTNLLSEGVLPILIAVENQNTKSSYFFEKNSFIFESKIPVDLQESVNLKAEQKRIEVKGKDYYNKYHDYWFSYLEPKLKSFTATSSEIASGIFLAVWGSALVYQKVTTMIKSEIIIHNIKKKTLMDKTYYPGTSQNGFVYIKLQEMPDISDISVIFIKATNLKNKEELIFTFFISQGGNKNEL